jgi:hypothetical protein
MKTYGGVKVFLTSALDGGEWSDSHPGRFTPRKRATGTHCLGGWVGPRAGLNAIEKNTAPAENRTPAVQPVPISSEISRLLRCEYTETIKETAFEDVDWIHLAQASGYWGLL